MCCVFVVRRVGEEKLYICFSQILFDFDSKSFLQPFSERGCLQILLGNLLVTPNRNAVAFRSFHLMSLKFSLLYCYFLKNFCFQRLEIFLNWILQLKTKQHSLELVKGVLQRSYVCLMGTYLWQCFGCACKLDCELLFLGVLAHF